MAQSRYFYACNKEINRLGEWSSNANTKKSIDVWLQVFASWANERKVEPEMSKYTPENYNSILCRYFAEIRKQGGGEYEPDCLRVMLAAMDRKLLEAKYPKTVKKDNELLECRRVLKGRSRELRAAGMGKKHNRAKSLTKEEEDILWASGLLGKESPRALLKAMFWLFTQHFGWRGRHGQHELKIEDFLFSKDDDGTEFIYFIEGPTKTRSHGLYAKHRTNIPEMFSTGDAATCPLMLFRTYIAHRPPQFSNKGPLYLSDIEKPTATVWYKSIPLGKNSTANIMKKNKNGLTIKHQMSREKNYQLLCEKTNCEKA